MLLRALIGGPYVAVLIWKELIHRLTGTRRDASLPTTIFAAAILAEALHRHPASPTRHLAKVARPAPPPLADAVMAVGGVRYALRSLGGDHVKDSPHAGTMIAVGLAAPAVRLVTTLAVLPIEIARAVLGALARALR